MFGSVVLPSAAQRTNGALARTLSSLGGTNFAGALAANAGSVLFQFVGLSLALAALSVEQLGLFLGIAAASAIAATFVGAGSIELLTAEVARKAAAAPVHSRSAMSRVALTGLVLLIPVSLLERLIFPSLPLVTIVIFNANYLFLARIVAIADGLYVAFGRSAVAASLRTLNAFLQAGSIGLLFLMESQIRLEMLSVLVLASGSVTAIASLWLLLPYLRSRRGDQPRIPQPWREGLHYMIGQNIASASANLDRVLAVSLLSEQASGMYALASRAAQLALVPTTTLFRTTYHKFFATTEDGAFDVHARRSILAATGLVSVASVIICCLGYALLVDLYASPYRSSVYLLFILSLSLPASGLTYYFGSQLAAARRIPWRNATDVVALVVFAALSVLVLTSTGSTVALAIAFVFSRYLNAFLYFACLRLIPNSR